VGLAFFFSSRRRHTSFSRDWSSDVCSSDLIPAAATRLAPIERLEAARRLNVALVLPLREQAALDALLQQLYDPADPQYHQYLTEIGRASRRERAGLWAGAGLLEEQLYQRGR